MAQVLIRNLDPETVESCRREARITAIPLEQELRDLLARDRPFTPEERVAPAAGRSARMATADEHLIREIHGFEHFRLAVHLSDGRP